MYVCVCNAVTDRDIRKAAEEGATTLQDLRSELNVATCCGRCATCAKRLLKEACSQTAAEPVLAISEAAGWT